MNMTQVTTDNEVFDKLRFVNEIGTKRVSQHGVQVRNHRLQDTGAVIHGKARTLGFEMLLGFRAHGGLLSQELLRT